MKAIAASVLCLSAAVSLLRSGSIPWRLVSKGEIDQMVAAQVQTERARSDASYAAYNGNVPFYATPGYRSALEKTTVIGVPERSRSREGYHPQ